MQDESSCPWPPLRMAGSPQIPWIGQTQYVSYFLSFDGCNLDGKDRLVNGKSSFFIGPGIGWNALISVKKNVKIKKMLGILWMIRWCTKLLWFMLIRPLIPGNEQIEIVKLIKPTPD